MLTNTMPFIEDVEHNWMIVEAQRARRYCYPDNFELSAACRLTVDAMMTFNAAKRPSIKECCYLNWFRSAYVKAPIQKASNLQFYCSENHIHRKCLVKNNNNVCNEKEKDNDVGLSMVSKYAQQNQTYSRQHTQDFGSYDIQSPLQSITNVKAPRVLKKDYSR